MRIITAAVLAGLAGTGLAGLALSGPSYAQTSNKAGADKGGMQGSPNAAGFGKGEDAAKPPMDDNSSAKNMKGPPNANGYDRK